MNEIKHKLIATSMLNISYEEYGSLDGDPVILLPILSKKLTIFPYVNVYLKIGEIDRNRNLC